MSSLSQCLSGASIWVWFFQSGDSCCVCSCCGCLVTILVFSIIHTLLSCNCVRFERSQIIVWIFFVRTDFSKKKNRFFSHDFSYVFLCLVLPSDCEQSRTSTGRPDSFKQVREEGMVTEGKRKKTKIILGTQSKARAAWPERLRLVQATPWADFAVITAQLWSTMTAIFLWVNNFAFNCYLRPRF